MRGRLGRSAMGVAAIAVIGAALTVLALEYRLRSERAATELRLSEVEEGLAALAREEALVEDYETMLEDLELRIAVITTLNDQECAPVDMFRSVAPALGAARLEWFRYEHRELVVGVRASELAGVVGAAEQLARVDGIAGLEIRGYREAASGGVGAELTGRCVEPRGATEAEGGLQ